MSLSATLFGRDSAIFKATNILGLGIPGWLDKTFGPEDTEGPRLSDLSVQTATYGADIARLYGTCALFGNVMWLENNKLKEKVKKNKSGGKGGASTDPTKTYSYSATFALGLCVGEIAAIRRIWCADKLIYSGGSNDLDTLIANNKAQSSFRLYRGTDDQMPDSRYEANVGAGNATAFRGIAYLVFYDFQLEEYSNTLQGSQFKVEVVKEATFLGLRQLNIYTISPTLEETSGTISLSENVISYSFDPADPRPWIGNVANYVAQYVRLDGTVIRQEPAPIYGGKPSGADYVIPNGKVGDLDIFYLWTLKGVERVIARRNGVQVSEFATYPEDYDPTPGAYPEHLGCHVNGDGLYLFRRNLAGAWRYEFSADAIEIDRAGDILNSDGSPYTASDLIVGQSIAAGYTPVVESGGSCVYLINSGGSEARSFLINDNGDFVFSETTNISGIPGNSICGAASNGVLAVLRGNKLGVITRQSSTTIESQSLPSIIEDECELSGLMGSSDIDVSLLTEDIRGYRIAGGTIRAALEPLAIVAPFDVIPSGYKLKFVPRGQSSQMVIPYADLGATGDQNPEDILSQSREMDTQLPAKTTIAYLDAPREYGVSENYSERINTPSVNKVEIELAVVLTADEAAKIAEVQTFGPIIERANSDFTLPPTYLELEPSDVVTVVGKHSTTEIRITDINYTEDGRLEIKSKSNKAAIYTSNASGSDGEAPDDTIGLPGVTLLVPMDIPVIDESIQNQPGFVTAAAGYSDGWPGALMVMSNDNGQTWFDVQAYVGQATIGTATSVLPASSCALIDERSISVRLVSGELESVTRDAMLSGTNYVAYGKYGRWEIVRFQTAVLQADGSYTVSGFCRGERGTEWASGLHADFDYFILLEDPDNAFVGMPVESIGLQRLIRGVTSGNSLDSADELAFTYKGVNLECKSPVYPKGSRDGLSNFYGSFTRRSRLSSSWWMTGVPAPIGETSEAYEIDVMSGSEVKRTIAVSSPAFTYSASDQVIDFGAAQEFITFRIYQLSSVVGRGYPLEVTL